MQLEPQWEYVSDGVMGGVSTGGLAREDVAGRRAVRLTGDVSLENNGGFVQMAFDLMPGGGALDASGWDGIIAQVYGNDEAYDLRLRTDQLTRPWQSFRSEFTAPPDWREVRLPFAAFQSHRTEAQFDPARLRRIGVLAIGRVFRADVAMAQIGFYKDDG